MSKETPAVREVPTPEGGMWVLSVRDHGIGVESEPGQGATFFFTLPEGTT